MVDAGVWRCVGDRLERRACSVGVSRSGHFPGEVHFALVDGSLVAALLHDGVFGVMRVAGGHTNQRVTRGRLLLTALFGHLVDVVVVGQGHHLRTEDVNERKSRIDQMRYYSVSTEENFF